MRKLKICLVTVRSILAISCLEKYRETVGENFFDLIYWDRHGIDEKADVDRQFKFTYRISSNTPKWRKMIAYYKFKLFAAKIIERNNYDIIITLPTQTSVLLYSLLIKKYHNRYILDIRDYMAENNSLFYKLQKKLIENSGIAVITSPGYQLFLPEHNYLISHNIPRIDKHLVEIYRSKKQHGKTPIVVSCIGSIRFTEQFKRVISYFGNDSRFQLRFIGIGAELLETFCKENRIKNVILKGRFNREETIPYYMETDIVMNLYGNQSPFLDYSLSNKLYYAATLGIPILVCPNTYMEEIAVKNGFGFSFDLNKPKMVDSLYEYYKEINWSSFFYNCDNFINRVKEDDKIFKTRVSEFVVSKRINSIL